MGTTVHIAAVGVTADDVAGVFGRIADQPALGASPRLRTRNPESSERPSLRALKRHRRTAQGSSRWVAIHRRTIRSIDP